MKNKAKFNIGDVVLHKKQGYRAVIVDADPLFQASGCYHPERIKRPLSFQHPWYRLLVDNSSLMTYVKEDLLEMMQNRYQAVTINNPQLAEYLKKQNGRYVKVITNH